MIGRNVEGLSHADLLAPAAGGGNTANWILGHLVNVHNSVMRIIGAPPVWEADQLERARFDHPIREADHAIDWDSLVERFTASRVTGRTNAGSSRTRLHSRGDTWPAGRPVSAITQASLAWRAVQQDTGPQSSPQVSELRLESEARSTWERRARPILSFATRASLFAPFGQRIASLFNRRSRVRV